MRPRDYLPHPTNGTKCFGVVPNAKSSHIVIPNGPIFLPYGKHYGPNHGFGVVHIWEEHWKYIAPLGHLSLADVPAFVSSIIQTGAPLHLQADRRMYKTRLQVVAGIRGVAILEERTDGENNIFYSVVTAFPGGKRDGPRIGKILDIASRQ